MNAIALLTQGDAVSQGVTLLLLLMSILSWVVIVWKAWLLQRVRLDLARCTAAFWQAPDLAQAQQRLQALDREGLVLPLLDASLQGASAGTLAGAAERTQHLTRLLRDALHRVLGRLYQGQVLLATVASTAPFVGLLGTVWGIYHALTGLAGAAQATLERVAGPVGEALIMTAAGLAVALPAVLAYNLMGRLISRIEADLEGFARDLRDLPSDAPAAVPQA